MEEQDQSKAELEKAAAEVPDLTGVELVLYLCAAVAQLTERVAIIEDAMLPEVPGAEL